MLFMTSMVLMPVWIISSGYVRSLGLMEEPLMSEEGLGKHRGPASGSISSDASIW